MLSISSDIFFLIGIALLPFENLFFAPSAGWGAISPLVFAVYVFLNIRYLNRNLGRYGNIFAFVLWGILVTIINFLFINQYLSAAVARCVSTIISLGLGLVSLLAFDIYLIEKRRSLEKVERILIIAYSVSLIVGFVQFLTVRFDISLIRELDLLLTKRTYLPFNRIQYTFTEPSFIGMHLFGILLPVYLYGKNKRIRNLIIAFAASAVLFFSGVRILIDIAAVAGIFLLFKIDFKKIKNFIVVAAAVFSLVIGISYLYNNNLRVRQIMNAGVYADGSFASRYFRINATIKGYKNDFVHVLFGYGYGQEVYPLAKGYPEAVAEYKNSYMSEVNSLGSAIKRNDESVGFCFWMRILSEGGVVGVLLLFAYFLRLYADEDNTWKAMMLIVFYIYIQFEAYAFYSIWLLIVLCKLHKYSKKENKEVFAEKLRISEN